MRIRGDLLGGGAGVECGGCRSGRGEGRVGTNSGAWALRRLREELRERDGSDWEEESEEEEEEECCAI